MYEKYIINQAILSLLLICFVALSRSYPRYHDDYTVTKTDLAAVFQDYAERLLDVSEDMPRPCRKDICYASKNESETKGEFIWPEILVAQKVELRCPFSFDVPVYTTRVCGLNYQGEAQWQDADYEYVCPDPPLAVLLRQFESELLDAYSPEFESDTTQIVDVYVSFIDRVVQVFTKYRDTPMNNDIEKLVIYYTIATNTLLVEQSQPVSLAFGKSILYILNTLLDDDLKWSFYGSLYETNRDNFVDLLNHLPSKLDVATNDYPAVITFSNLALYVINITRDTPDKLNITEGFTNVMSSGDTVYSPQVSIDTKRLNKKDDPVIVGVLIVKEALILSYEYTWTVQEDFNHIDFNNYRNYAYESPFYNYGYMGNFEHKGVTSDDYAGENTTPESNLFKFTYPVDTTTVNRNVTYEVTTHDFNITTYHDQLGTTAPMSTNQEENIRLFTRTVHNFEVLGGGIYITSLTEDYHVTEHIAVLYEIHTCENISNCPSYPACVSSTKGDKYIKWAENGCQTVDNQLDNGFVSCQCNGLGSFGVFFEDDGLVQDYPLALPTLEIIVQEGDISSFVGFPYRKELDILGNVLGAISLVCLVATVASYSIFRRTRSGSPTTVLLNLCVALIALSVLLFTIYIFGNHITMTGCTVTNTLRYYLVFVTLTWNGVEAFNMYMMIVRVFNSNISKFGVKAGIVSWGFPAIMVAICYGVSRKAFNGKHVLISEKLKQCIFQCQLQDNTLYYGYLIPMAVIIIHNFIMFGFVLNAILKNGSQLGKAKKNKKIVQLIGAVATLVLLGVPWMFSAFGAIDAATNQHLKWTEGVFQVIFVVFVNLQGLFIFIFHCVRNTQMRQSWSNVIKRSSSLRQSQNTGMSSLPDSAGSVRSKRTDEEFNKI